MSRAWGSASQVLSPGWQGTEPMVAGWVLNPIHLHAQLQGEGPAAPQLWGTSCCPTALGDIPAAPRLMAQGDQGYIP